MPQITEWLSDDSSSSDDDDDGSSVLGPAGAGIRWLSKVTIGNTGAAVAGLKGGIMQSGRRDFLAATIVSLVVFIPVWLVGSTSLGRGLVCSGGVGTMIAGGIQLLVGAFVLKGLLRAMFALDQPDSGLEDPILSAAAGIVPVIVGSMLTTGGTSVIVCLFS